MKTTIDDVKIARVFKKEYKSVESVETLARLVTLTREVYGRSATRSRICKARPNK